MYLASLWIYLFFCCKGVNYSVLAKMSLHRRFWVNMLQQHNSNKCWKFGGYYTSCMAPSTLHLGEMMALLPTQSMQGPKPSVSSAFFGG